MISKCSHAFTDFKRQDFIWRCWCCACSGPDHKGRWLCGGRASDLKLKTSLFLNIQTIGSPNPAQGGEGKRDWTQQEGVKGSISRGASGQQSHEKTQNTGTPPPWPSRLFSAGLSQALGAFVQKLTVRWVRSSKEPRGSPEDCRLPGPPPIWSGCTHTHISDTQSIGGFLQGKHRNANALLSTSSHSSGCGSAALCRSSLWVGFFQSMSECVSVVWITGVYLLPILSEFECEHAEVFVCLISLSIRAQPLILRRPSLCSLRRRFLLRLSECGFALWFESVWLTAASFGCLFVSGKLHVIVILAVFFSWWNYSRSLLFDPLVTSID